jgi:hypothetical protein
MAPIAKPTVAEILEGAGARRHSIQAFTFMSPK